MKHRDTYLKTIKTYVRDLYPKNSVKPRWGDHGLEIVRHQNGWTLEWRERPVMFRNGTGQFHIGRLQGDNDFMEIAQMVVQCCEQFGIPLASTEDLDSMVIV